MGCCMKHKYLLVMLMVIISFQSFASENQIKKVNGAIADDNVKPSKEAIQQLVTKINAIYKQEGGKRSKDIIRDELIANSTLGAFTQVIIKDLENKEFNNIHSLVNIAQKRIDEMVNRQPKINVDKEKLALIYTVDGQAYADVGNIKDAINSYNKSLSYKKTAMAYFQLGFVCTASKDSKNGDKYFKLATQLDKSFHLKVKDAKAYISKNSKAD